MVWLTVFPHKDVGKFPYYQTYRWGDYFCPHCGWRGYIMKREKVATSEQSSTYQGM
jgi:hypothetical protein